MFRLWEVDCDTVGLLADVSPWQCLISNVSAGLGIVRIVKCS